MPESNVGDGKSLSAGPKRIAVVAIHGVGDHEQFSTAREIGDLLSNLTYKLPGAHDDPPRYAPFTEVMKRINVRPVKTNGNNKAFKWGDKAMERKTWGPMDELARAVFQNKLTIDHQDNSPASLDHLFMKGQLVKHSSPGPDDTYQCLRLEGRRVAPIREPGQAAPHPAPDAAGSIASDLREAGVELPRTSPADGSPGTDEKTVHIYEMYWADLSKLGSGFTQIFSELYQVLFHLGSVSVNNILAAAIYFHNRPGGPAWRRFCNAQWFAAAILAWPIPILNLYLSALIPTVMALSLMRTHLSAHGEFIALDILGALILSAAFGYVLSKLRGFPAWLFPVPLLLFGSLATLAGFVFDRPDKPWNRNVTEQITAAIVLALALGLVSRVVNAYEKRRPGSRPAAMWIGGILAVVLAAAFWFGGCPIGGPGPYPAIAMCLNVLEIAFAFLALSWSLFYWSYLWAHFTGALALRSVRRKREPNPKHDPEYTKACRTRWTAQLVLALSSLAFISLTLPIWAGVISVVQKMLPGQSYVEDAGLCASPKAPCNFVRGETGLPCDSADCPPVTYSPVSALLYRFAWRQGLSLTAKFSDEPGELEGRAEHTLNHPESVAAWANDMWLASGLGFLPLLLIALLVALLFSAWALFPSVRDEITPPETHSADPDEHRRGHAAARLRRESVAMGSWLDRGFRFMRWGGNVVYWTMFGLMPFFVWSFRWMYHHKELLQGLAGVTGTLVAGAAVGIFGFAGRIQSLGGAFRPLVRVMLDVDNWLREHPRESNPTARICARYASLLRHICAWRDSEDGKSPYEAIVVVAHSQGTVITADFLRYLNAERLEAGSMAGYDPELALFDKPLPVYLFTMGCPLHQLYGLRFPYLYGWARNDLPIESPEPTKPPDIGPDDAPRPEHLGVERWVNAYRSGDYVGRYLWRGGGAGYQWDPIHTSWKDEWDPPAGKPERVSADKAGTRIECCIGPGAHTHYWDHTGGLIAEVLDRMINNA